jgi:hypothetical protein
MMRPSEGYGTEDKPWDLTGKTWSEVQEIIKHCPFGTVLKDRLCKTYTIGNETFESQSLTPDPRQCERHKMDNLRLKKQPISSALEPSTTPARTPAKTTVVVLAAASVLSIIT